MSKRVLRMAALAAVVVAALLLLAVTCAVLAGPPALPVGELPAAGQAARAAAAPTSYSSGWVTVPANGTYVFYHNLNCAPDDLAVDLWFRDVDGGLGIHRRFYGGATQGVSELGAHWLRLTANSLNVSRWKDDTVVDQMLARVWVQPSAPDYDSGWTPIQAGQTITLLHDLGQTATDLTVGLCFSTTSGTMHHFAYGGLVQSGPVLLGAYWHNLTGSTVRVTRLANDSIADRVRVTVTRGSPPAYDSLVQRGGWQSIAPGTLVTFTHNLGVSPELQVLRSECLSPDPALGIHHAFAGGEYDERISGWVGSNVQNVTANSVTVYRQAQDAVCPQVRVVVYVPSVAARLYLPLLVRQHSVP